MSGIEIAGLIMGAFPLLMAALERYREGAELLSDWWRIQRAYKKCKQDINYHRILFEGNLEEFLLPLVADEDELKVLMANPAGEAWEDPELEKRLQDRLPKSYELYLDIIGDINELMDKLKKELGVDNAQFQSKVNESQTPAKTKPSRKDLLTVSNFEFQAKRIKFSLKKASREKLFGELQEYNDKLRKLLESSDRTSAARRAREPKQTTLIADRKLGEFWRYAKKLHDALAKAWRCGCSSHEANLRLQHRTSDEADFDVLFRTKTAADIWKWQETNIKMIQTDCSVNAVAITVTEVDDTNPPPAISQHRRMMGPRPSAFNMGKHSVSILNIPGKSSSVTLPAKPRVGWATPDSHSQSAPNLHTSPKIVDLCNALSQTAPTCLGFLEEDDVRFMLYPTALSESSRDMDTITLGALLQDPDQSFTRRQRYSLALTLASSYLQLGSTPWLNAPLHKDDIIMLRRASEPNFTFSDQTYICRNFSSCSPADASRALSTLGIRLLELCFGTALEAHKFRRQLPAGDEISAPMLDYAAALQWSKTVGEEAGPEFAEAVEWCLHSNASSGDGWRKDIVKHVIDPLEYCHQQYAQVRF